MFDLGNTGPYRPSLLCSQASTASTGQVSDRVPRAMSMLAPCPGGAVKCTDMNLTMADGCLDSFESPLARDTARLVRAGLLLAGVRQAPGVPQLTQETGIVMRAADAFRYAEPADQALACLIGLAPADRLAALATLLAGAVRAQVGDDAEMASLALAVPVQIAALVLAETLPVSAEQRAELCVNVEAILDRRPGGDRP